MITQVWTENSVYEIDSENKKVRRLQGKKDPTPRQGPDGEWKSYIDLVGPELGKFMVIVWRYEDGVAKTTVSSPVSKVVGEIQNITEGEARMWAKISN